MRSKSLLGVLSLLMALTIGARGQSEGYVEARIRFISTTRPLMGVGVVSDRKPHGFVIPTDFFSEEVVYRGKPRLELLPLEAKHKEPEPGPKSEEDTPKEQTPRKGIRAKQITVTYSTTGAPPLAWADLPQKQGMLHLIILVTPGQGNGMVMLNDKPGSFPPGSNRYLNLCPFPLTVRAPSGDYVIPAGSSQILRPGALDKTYYDLQVLSRESEVLFSSRIHHLEARRKLYLLSQMGSGKNVHLKSIVDLQIKPDTGTKNESGKK